ncbi:hypothetical protein [Streptomyces hainanensis]|uniref:hypothetical protein n=1 Tax=Streptomyces hainanensis TaxID=402648 RepID=UPI001A9F11CD
MFGLLAHQGVGSIPWSPLAGGLVTRPWGDRSTSRGQANPTTDQQGRPLFLDSDLTDDEAKALEEHYTPREPTYF